MKLFNRKKHRTFDLAYRLHGVREGKKRIEFDRLPRKKMRSVWWYFFLFMLAYALYQYLR